MVQLLTSAEFKSIEKKILTDLEPISTLLKEVPAQPVPSFKDVVTRIKYTLKNSAKKTAKTAKPDLAVLEKTEIDIKLDVYKSPLIEIDADTISGAKKEGFPVEQAINTAVLYDLVEQENRKIIDILSKTPTEKEVTWTDKSITEKVNSIFETINTMRKNKVPVQTPKLILNPTDIGQLGFNDYLNSGLKVLQSDLNIKIIPCTEVDAGTGILYESNPRVVEFPIALPAKPVRVNPETDPPEKYAWYVKEKWGGGILHDGGVVKLTIE